MSAGGVFTFPTERDDVPDDYLQRLAARGVPSDYRVGPDGMHTWSFPTSERMAAMAARRVVADDGMEEMLHVDRYCNAAWCGASHEVACWMGTVAGWPEAAALAIDVYDKLTANRLASRIPRLCYEDEPGEDVDVSMYLAGEDSCFVAMRATDTTVRGGRSAVTVRHNMFASAHVNMREQVVRGLIATAIVHLLETAGVRVSVELDVRWTHGGRDGSLLTTLKHYGEPADIPRLTYWLAHPSAFRRVVFAIVSPHFRNMSSEPQYDPDDVIRVSDALVGGGNVDAVAVARQTLAAAGFVLE